VQRNIGAAEQQAREQLLRETAEGAAEEVAIFSHLKINPRDGQSPLTTKN